MAELKHEPVAHDQIAFLARGLKSLETAKKTENYVDADVVLEKLRQRLQVAKMKAATRHAKTSPHNSSP